MYTRQIRLLNKECHMCGKSPPNGPSMVMFDSSPKLNPKENAETLEPDEDN